MDSQITWIRPKAKYQEGQVHGTGFLNGRLAKRWRTAVESNNFQNLGTTPRVKKARRGMKTQG